MKNYTIHFLIATIITFLLGFTGLDFTGSPFIRFIFLLSAIGLLISCLDEVMVIKKMKPVRIKRLKKEIKK